MNYTIKDDERRAYVSYRGKMYIQNVNAEIHSYSPKEFEELFGIKKEDITEEDIREIANTIIETDIIASNESFFDNLKNELKRLKEEKEKNNLKERIKQASDYNKKRHQNLYQRLADK